MNYYTHICIISKINNIIIAIKKNYKIIMLLIILYINVYLLIIQYLMNLQLCFYIHYRFKLICKCNAS